MPIFPILNVTIPPATAKADGLLTAADKTKLDALPTTPADPAEFVQEMSNDGTATGSIVRVLASCGSITLAPPSVRKGTTVVNASGAPLTILPGMGMSIEPDGDRYVLAHGGRATFIGIAGNPVARWLRLD